MKSLQKTLLFLLLALTAASFPLRAQWDTIKNYNGYSTNDRLHDIYFKGSIGFAVGHQPLSTSYFQRVGCVSKTTDGGLTWTNILLPQAVGSDSVVDLMSVYFTTSSTGYAAATCLSITGYYYGAVLESTDGGLTWSNIYSTRSQISTTSNSSVLFNSIQFTSLNRGFVAGYTHFFSSTGTAYSMVYTTTNGGATWNSSVPSTISPASALFFDNSGTGCVAHGFSENAFAAFSSNNDWYYPEYYTGMIARSTDGGLSWSVTNIDPNYAYTDIHFPSSQIGYASGIPLNFSSPGEILKTTDGGVSWTVAATIPNFWPRCIYFTDDSTGYIAGIGNTSIYKTTDGGASWTPQTYPTVAGNLRIVSLDFSTPATGYALCDSTSANTSASILGDFSASTCAVYLGPDTTFCQTQGQLFATPATPSSNYIFSWSPGTGLSDSTAQNPFVNHVYNQQYVVTMTDTITNCTATDTIVVSAFEWTLGPMYTCLPDSTFLDLGPGATFYQWQTYTDTAGNVTPINQNTQTYWATQQGYYLGIASFAGCGVLTTYVQLLDTCGTYAWVNNVWPGDCNYDLTANMADVLNIGLGYGTTGATRPSANNSWTAQPMNDWTQNFTTCNYKHADANGDGIIDMNDTLPINLNYGLTHPYRLQQPSAPASAPSLYLVANYDTVGLQTLVTVDVRLGTSSIPVDSLYGISFRLKADEWLIDTTLTTINMNTTWLGTMGNNAFNFQKHFRNAGTVDAAETREDHTNRLGGNGTIATFSIVTTDNLSGISICHFHVSDVTAVTVSENYLAMNTADDSVVIDPGHPAGIEPGAEMNSFSVYPNPSNAQVTVQTTTVADKIEICDVLGQSVLSMTPVTTTIAIPTSQLAEGVYFLRVHHGDYVTTQKISVRH